MDLQKKQMSIPSFPVDVMLVDLGSASDVNPVRTRLTPSCSHMCRVGRLPSSSGPLRLVTMGSGPSSSN